MEESRELPIAYKSKHLNERCTVVYHRKRSICNHSDSKSILFISVWNCLNYHAALQYMMSKRESIGRLTRWAIYLQQFDLEIKYWPGKLHKNTDALTRTPIFVVMSNFFVFDDWLIGQHEDQFCKP